VRGAWNSQFLEEVPRFGLPAVHDDIVDALALAHYALTQGTMFLPSTFSLAKALEGMTQPGMEQRAQRAALLPASVRALWGEADDELL
jgi:aspartate aminotransferase-like enzyme